MIRVAVVGVGGYGSSLIDGLRKAGQRGLCRLVAAADARLDALADRAEALAREGVQLYDDAAGMFADQRGRCEAVYIASSIPTHAPLTVAAARCGYHVHLEKPPAATVQEIDEMLAALDAAGRMCLVGFQAFHGHMRLIVEALAAGRLGRVERITCAAGWPRNRDYYARNDWAGRFRTGPAWVLDGPVTNALAHQLAHMLAMAAGRPGALARPAAVRAELYAAGDVESHNTAAIEVRTAEGPIIHFFCSHATAGMFGPQIEVFAERARAVYHPNDGSTIFWNDGPAEKPQGTDDAQDEMIANFLDAVAAAAPARLRCPLAETRKYTLALDGAHESSGRVHRIAGEHFRVEQAGTGEQHVVVEGLDDAIAAANRQGKLFSDLPQRPAWAVATEPFDLADYRRFPQRFQCAG